MKESRANLFEVSEFAPYDYLRVKNNVCSSVHSSAVQLFKFYFTGGWDCLVCLPGRDREGKRFYSAAKWVAMKEEARCGGVVMMRGIDEERWLVFRFKPA